MSYEVEKEVSSLFKNLKKSYDSGDGDDLGNDFFTPCLKLCNEYLRNTSDFTSNVIFEWGEAVIKLIERSENKTKIKIIAHPKLHEKDLEVLKEYVNNQYRREEHLEKLSDNILEEAFEIAEGKADQAVKLKILAYLIASKTLELKFAFPHHVPKANVFHSKFGVYKFNNEKKIAFIGGPNETLGGHSRNIEDIEIFSSTNPHDLERIIKREKKFEEYWKDNAKGFRTKSLSDQNSFGIF